MEVQICVFVKKLMLLSKYWQFANFFFYSTVMEVIWLIICMVCSTGFFFLCCMLFWEIGQMNGFFECSSQFQVLDCSCYLKIWRAVHRAEILWLIWLLCRGQVEYCDFKLTHKVSNAPRSQMRTFYSCFLNLWSVSSSLWETDSWCC